MAKLPGLSISNPLSHLLRSETALAHRAIEARLGFPGTITDLERYRQCLQRFYQFYRPLEGILARFEHWPETGIQICDRAQSPRLYADLRILGTDVLRLDDAPAAALPVLPTFAHTFGALYVLEGSTLGSQMILRYLRSSLGPQLAGADAFFNGHGLHTGVLWGQFREAIDAFGVLHPGTASYVLEGAVRTFQALGDWMTLDNHT